jgi:hypothetical protein
MRLDLPIPLEIKGGGGGGGTALCGQSGRGGVASGRGLTTTVRAIWTIPPCVCIQRPQCDQCGRADISHSDAGDHSACTFCHPLSCSSVEEFRVGGRCSFVIARHALLSFCLSECCDIIHTGNQKQERDPRDLAIRAPACQSFTPSNTVTRTTHFPQVERPQH